MSQARCDFHVSGCVQNALSILVNIIPSIEIFITIIVLHLKQSYNAKISTSI